MNTRILRLTASVSIILITCFALFSQANIETLDRASLIERNLQKGEDHAYKVVLEEGHFFLATLTQIGIDIVINVTGPNGSDIGTFDSPNGTNGPEYIQFNTPSSGEYTLNVMPLAEYDDFEPGSYTLKINKMEEIASTPSGRVEQMMAVWDQPGSPGASIAVMKKGEIIYSQGFGSAQLEYEIPNGPNTIFHIASISKQFTAFCMALLADQGKISLDEDIRTYLPYVPDFGKTITVRHLVHHTSGLRDQWNLLAMAGWRLDDVITKDHIVKLVSNQKDLNFDPGEEYVYCNTGYTLMAEIVEAVTDLTFAEWTEKNIFEPLGMNHTLFYDDHQKIVKNRAYSYGSSSDGFEKRVLSYANAGATSLFTTVEDLSKWAWNFNKVKVGSEAVMDVMHTRGVLNSGDTISYAFGQVMGDYKGLATVSHGGADAGYRTYLVRFPEEEMSITVFSNLGSFNPGGIAYQVADIFMEDRLPDQDTKEDESEEESEMDDVSEKVEIPSETLESYVGRYELFPGFVLSISVEDGHLVGQATGQPQVDLRAVSLDSFFVSEANAYVTFSSVQNEKAQQLTLYQGGGIMPAPRMPEFDPDAVDLTAFEGTFVSEELGTSYRFMANDDHLKVIHQRHEDFELTPLKQDVFSGNRWFFGQVTFIKDDSGQVNGCKVSSGRVRNVHFDKM